MKFVFGTDGWRARIGEGFDLPHIRTLGKAVVEYIKSLPGEEKSIVVGHDTRFLGEFATQELISLATQEKIPVYVIPRWIPTPVLSFAVTKKNATLGIMITASHNPYPYNGLKLKASYGGTVPSSVYQRVEEIANAIPSPPAPQTVKKQYVEIYDPVEDYFAYINQLVPVEEVSSMAEGCVWDAMHGATGKLFSLLFQGKATVHSLRVYPDARFGLADPEPIPRNLNPLAKRICALHAPLGLAADGDGDRLGVMTSKGEFVTPHEVFALITWMLCEEGVEGNIGKTFSSSLYLNRLAEHYGRKIMETGIGFKYLSPLLIEGEIMIGGEESGGLALAHGLPERDSIVTALHLLKALSLRQHSLETALENLRKHFGPYYYGRNDVPLEDRKKVEAFLQDLFRHPPSKVLRYKVTEVGDRDGVKLTFGNRGWLLFRLSGTEPLLRIYAEMPSLEEVSQVLEQGKRWITL